MRVLMGGDNALWTADIHVFGIWLETGGYGDGGYYILDPDQVSKLCRERLRRHHLLSPSPAGEGISLRRHSN
jgi:hypothetical protein